METGDRKLNEVTKVTDMAYVPVIMADGSIGQIAKSDLASVVAGVMGFSVNDALTYKGILTAELEASATLPNGIYRQNENPMLSSDGVTNLYRGMLISIRGIADGSGNYYGTQFYLTGDGTVKHQRAIEFGYVRPWQRIDNFGYNSLAELSAGVVSARKFIMDTGTNLNDVTETGIYRAGGVTVENTPVSVTYFMLIVESFDNRFVKQTLVHNDGRIWVRSQYASEWRAWKQIV